MSKHVGIIIVAAALLLFGVLYVILYQNAQEDDTTVMTGLTEASTQPVIETPAPTQTPSLTPRELAELKKQEAHAVALEALQPFPQEGPIHVLEFFKAIQGEYTLTAMHNREPNSEPDMQTERMKKLTGVTPAMWSGDFLFSADDVSNRQKMIDECMTQWDNGAIVHIMLHVTAPGREEVGSWNGDVLCTLTDAEWESLIEDGGELNKVWKSRLDIYAEYFTQLREHGVTVMFRPFHEMNQGAFWWGGRPGPEGTAALYRLTHDYFANEKKLNNIIWVWNMQDLDYDWEAYNPGDEYWDIFSVDFYNGDGYTQRKYDLAIEVADGKPMGIGECEVFPTLAELEDQKQWTFFMGWAELAFNSNSDNKIWEIYNSSHVLVLEELPDFNNFNDQEGSAHVAG